MSDNPDLENHLREVRLGDLRYERESRRAQDATRDAIASLYESSRGFYFPGGFFAFVRDELDRLEDQVAPVQRSERRKRRLPAALRKRIFERDRYRCVSCGGWVDLTIDHKIPESLGGTDEDENLQTMCRPCNSSKGTKAA